MKLLSRISGPNLWNEISNCAVSNELKIVNIGDKITRKRNVMNTSQQRAHTEHLNNLWCGNWTPKKMEWQLRVFLCEWNRSGHWRRRERGGGGGGDDIENADFSTCLKWSATESRASHGYSNSKVTNEMIRQNATKYCERIRLQYWFHSLPHYNTV
jgi:hypothetical protein